eukprot:1089596-Amphidinium_carterae.1
MHSLRAKDYFINSTLSATTPLGSWSTRTRFEATTEAASNLRFLIKTLDSFNSYFSTRETASTYCIKPLLQDSQ